MEHCKHGHEFTPENTIIRNRPSGGLAADNEHYLAGLIEYLRQWKR